VLGTAEDIDAERRGRDELARKDAQLRQAQKMESLGRLAGGVAHDFNNLLTAISGYSELGAASDDPAEMKDALNCVGEVAEQAAALTRQLLAFSRGQRIAPVDVDLNELVRSMQTALEMLVGDDVELRLDLAAHVDSVNIDPTAAQQSVLNLVVNARDAMPAGGTLTIGTENDHDELLLTVSDEGVGMSGDTLARAFDPFFTTKETGHGLGLSAVLGLVEQAGGDVQVTSAPDAGTTFELRLPTSGGHPAGDAGGGPRRRPAGAPAWTERTVLVVEDTPFVRNLVVSYLESCGWRVLSATNGRDALSVAAAEPVDVVLTDAVMPEMGGYELTDRLHAIHRDLPVLVMSGYAHAPPAEPPRGAAFIQKPFVLAELQAMIDELLVRRDGT